MKIPDELPPDLADELEIIAMEAMRGGRGPAMEGRLKRDLTVATRRYNPRAEVKVRTQGAGVGVLLLLPDRHDKVRMIRLTFDVI